MKFSFVSLTKQKGLAQIPIILGLLLMAIAIPIATKLSQQEQDTREMAASGGAWCDSVSPECTGGQLFVCTANHWTMVQSCPNGCNTGGTACNVACSYAIGSQTGDSCGPAGGCPYGQRKFNITKTDCNPGVQCLQHSSCPPAPTTPPNVPTTPPNYDCGNHVNGSNWCEGNQSLYLVLTVLFWLNHYIFLSPRLHLSHLISLYLILSDPN